MKYLMILFTLMLLVPAVAHAGPVSSGFTYQGQLILDDMAITGTADFQFYLHDAETGGSMVGGGLQYNAVNVDLGVFTVTLPMPSTPSTVVAVAAADSGRPTGRPSRTRTAALWASVGPAR